jgi:hypothetical protein
LQEKKIVSAGQAVYASRFRTLGADAVAESLLRLPDLAKLRTGL